MNDQIGNVKRRQGVCCITDHSGNLKYTSSEIADAFAVFYSKLYSSEQAIGSELFSSVQDTSPISIYAKEELCAALRLMSNHKACDKMGIVAEMLKCGSERLQSAILDLFNDVLDPNKPPLATWKQTKLIVIFKKGDPTLPSNYRPIAILPILYKLFSRMLCARMKKKILQKQSVDQAAYRDGFSTEDHLLSVSLLAESCAEWNAELWIALVDFKKAFDTVEHGALWSTLRNQGVEMSYIYLLQRPYKVQTATVFVSVESLPFSLLRGVKQ